MVKFNFTLSAVNGEKKTAKQVYGVVRRNAHVPYGDFAKRYTDSKGNPLANGYGNKQD